MKKSDSGLLMEQLSAIAEGLSRTFSPFCEVVVHDLTQPEHAILAIHNNLSGRKEGDPVTELGLARIASPDFPDIIANYANTFADGRPVKSTSIGLKNAKGDYVAALCMNVDMTLFRGIQNTLAQFTQTDTPVVPETLEPAGAESLRQRIDQFAASRATTPRTLKAGERRELLLELRKTGLLDVKRSMETVASHLGISRSSVYLYLKEQP